MIVAFMIEKNKCDTFDDAVMLYKKIVSINVSICSNSFFRILEFIIGAILRFVWIEVKEKKWYKKYVEE